MLKFYSIVFALFFTSGGSMKNTPTEEKSKAPVTYETWVLITMDAQRSRDVTYHPISGTLASLKQHRKAVEKSGVQCRVSVVYDKYYKVCKKWEGTTYCVTGASTKEKARKKWCYMDTKDPMDHCDNRIYFNPHPKR